MLFAKCIIIFTHSKFMNFQIPNLQRFCSGFCFVMVFLWSERQEGIFVGHKGIILHSRDGWTLKKVVQRHWEILKIFQNSGGQSPEQPDGTCSLAVLRADQTMWLYRFFLAELFYDLFVTCHGGLLIWYVSYMGGKKPKLNLIFRMDLAAQTLYSLLPSKN